MVDDTLSIVAVLDIPLSLDDCTQDVDHSFQFQDSPRHFMTGGHPNGNAESDKYYLGPVFPQQINLPLI